MEKKLQKINYESIAMWTIVTIIALVGSMLIYKEATEHIWN
jgi:hypothetical protein